ncbi:uncharacterized protein LOC112520291 [Cynara cardunculus var. scolymus]|uniref:MADF domain-containing protein n=1 Tax=Cynara cardunculus var. scolymus TaxID=59895 RepID=A0A118JZX9_CYNCS|nr:uncharacterized protein LOC112520291 [Cynara cardunculus var. scolymus]KVI00542.1 MADF domain-containing protein [Cynara cardunculus var. scolymus]
MANSYSPSSSQEPANPQPSTSSRRLPPPCWSDEETVALIDAYRDKWYSLRRGNLRASHWQEVADSMAAQCPLSDPPKSSIQCRHKMEKLRKRYRSEIQRIGNTPRGHRYPSSWVHFTRMDSMELGSDPSDDPTHQDEEEEDENQNNLLLYPKGIKQSIRIPLNRRQQGSIGNGNRNGVRIKIPNIAAVPPPSSVLNLYNSNRSLDDYPPLMNPYYGSGKDRNVGVKRRVEDGDNPMDEMVAAIGKLGDGILKVERMKMDMAKELESMRLKMEMKRTEMILESQQKLVDSFSTTVMEKKKKKIKRIPTPES